MSKPASQWDDCFYGSVTVGERGQIVIPAEARADLGIKHGDKLLVMKHPLHKGLMISRIEVMREFLDEFKQMLDTMSDQEVDPT